MQKYKQQDVPVKQTEDTEGYTNTSQQKEGVETETQNKESPTNVEVSLKTRTQAKLKQLPQVTDIANPTEPEFRPCYTYTLKQIKFLDEYQKDLDADRAARAAKVSNTTKNNWLKDQKITEVINRINDAYKEAIFMNSKYAAGKFMQIYQKLEKRFDEGKDVVAGPLAKMADSALKATGHFAAESENTGTQVQINIDLSTNNTPKTIKVKQDETG